MCTHVYVIEPVYLLESVPPKVSSPFVEEVEVVGSKEMPTSYALMRPWEYALSVTVGMQADSSSVNVPDQSISEAMAFKTTVDTHRM